MINKLKPLKRFGQNYLIDNNIINKIVDEFDPQPEDVIIEIGPGSGALTSILAKKTKKLIAIEIDTRVIKSLKIKFPQIEIVNKDFLEVDLNDLIIEAHKLRIIGNIPYNITSPVIFKLIENRKLISDAMLMTQYEVAKRITGGKGTKDYGILSVLLNYFADPHFCFKISPNVFYPKPKVYSAVIKLDFSKSLDEKVNDEQFIKVVKAAFGNRRKTLKNSLSNSIFKGVEIDSTVFDIKRRAEELSVQEFVELTKLINRHLKSK